MNMLVNERLDLTKSSVATTEKKQSSKMFKFFKPTSFVVDYKLSESRVSAVPIYEKYVKRLNKTSQERFRDLKQVSLAQI